ncbi:MAG: DUF2085 domain-containing protein [Chloroflexi bacterium]|nr:DUF2085 domain-containing protein [Chloroflexota bacterium]MCL5074881.1 DUF2085 domain-containing protein [Chloroflexota bacterium]
MSETVDFSDEGSVSTRTGQASLKARPTFSRFISLEGLLDFALQRWLLLLNLFMGLFATLPLLAPLLMTMGQVRIAQWIYMAYTLSCHQLPERSFFLFGYQMAYCQRDTAIYTTMFLCGLLFALGREGMKPLPWRLYLLFIAPMAIDGLGQALGWWESTWEVRILTGILFGAASIWLLYPRMEKATREVLLEVESEQVSPVQ